MEQTMQSDSKMILFDATGEYYKIEGATHVQLGGAMGTGPTAVSLPYFELNEADLLVLFNPSSQSQAPKLRAAIKSLKLAKLIPGKCPEGFVPKANKTKAPFDALCNKYTAELESPKANFEIKHLAKQLDEECVKPNIWTAGLPDYTQWGGYRTGSVTTPSTDPISHSAASNAV
jgi:hypothetical protein